MLQELERPLTSDNVDGIAQSYIKRAQSSFWYFRCLIDPTIKHAWWQQVAAQYLQDFYADMVNGKRPKIIIQAPPQHGKSRLVSDFVGWVAGKDPELKTIFTSYSDELGVTANLRLQRMLQTRAYRKTFPETRISGVGEKERWLHNTSVLEYVGHTGGFRNTTVNGQITGHGLDLGVVDDPSLPVDSRFSSSAW
jgi:hypothetical protein